MTASCIRCGQAPGITRLGLCERCLAEVVEAHMPAPPGGPPGWRTMGRSLTEPALPPQATEPAGPSAEWAACFEGRLAAAEDNIRAIRVLVEALADRTAGLLSKANEGGADEPV